MSKRCAWTMLLLWLLSSCYCCGSCCSKPFSGRAPPCRQGSADKPAINQPFSMRTFPGPKATTHSAEPPEVSEDLVLRGPLRLRHLGAAEGRGGEGERRGEEGVLEKKWFWVFWRKKRKKLVILLVFWWFFLGFPRVFWWIFKPWTLLKGLSGIMFYFFLKQEIQWVDWIVKDWFIFGTMIFRYFCHLTCSSKCLF